MIGSLRLRKDFWDCHGANIACYKKEISSYQHRQIFISPRESRVSVCLTLTRVRHYLYCHFMVAMVITFLLVFSFSGHLLDFSMVPARGNNYRRRMDPITYTLSNSSRCRLTQSCLCYRSRLAPKQKYSMTIKNVELRFI